MNPILRNLLAVVAGLVIGGIVNMTLVSISGSIIPIPEGINPNDVNSLKENIHRFEAKHFLMPFLAHALGTLIAALVAVKLAVSQHFRIAIFIGVLYLIGGIIAVFMIPAPTWFCASDLIVAYIPMAYIGYKLAF